MTDPTEMTDPELRRLVDEAEEQFAPIERMIGTAGAGTFVCPRCCGNAAFERTGRNWQAECRCGWNAAGRLPASSVKLQ
jgi:hypothetical protein